jgi:hypothetical protein
LASYQNYDFVPGNNILFEDEFTEDDAGEFPSHWNLSGGQAILNMAGKDKAFFLTDGNYVHDLCVSIQQQQPFLFAKNALLFVDWELGFGTMRFGKPHRKF